MELLIIRHGLPIRMDNGAGGVKADPGLAEEGWEQARALAAWLVADPPHAIYASPLRRAMETARPLADATGLDVVTRDRLVEFDSDASFYIPLEELRRSGDPRFEQLIEDWTGPARTEDRAEFRAGVVSAIDAIAAAHPDERVAVVCHGGVINNYLAEVLHMSNSLFFQPHYTSVSRVRVSPGGGRLFLSANECGHLRAPQPTTDGPAL